MCGRARCSLGREEAIAAAGVAADKWRDYEKFLPKYNLGPGSRTPIVRRDKEGDTELQTMTWGLVPSWTKKEEKLDFFRMFNARSETVPEKTVFSRLLGSKRCVVLLNGFYEWAQEHKTKQPYYIHLDGNHIMRMAGLYDSWQDAEGNWLYTYTILTTDSSKRLQWLHDRMPVILPDAQAAEAWLQNGTLDTKQYAALCTPYNGEDLHWFPVTPAMSKPDFQGPECCKPLKRQSIATFFKPKQTAKAPEVTRELKTEPGSETYAAPAVKAEDDTEVSKETSSVNAEESPSKVESRGPDDHSGKKRPRQKDQGSKDGSEQKRSKPSPAKPAKKKGPLDSFFIKNPA
ncbi:Abasic site processing protein HMCES [Coccomyxa sp. Obi]|nr:Abasic site processing protein HMCES [Coccomyxa sp. Obi]